jgi:UDPglucose 6-dehydrogenase
VKVAFVGGAGRLGLPFALWSAEHGHEVIISDINETALDAIRAGQLNRTEPMIKELARKHGKSLTLLSNNALAAQMADLVCIVTATPSMPTGGFSSEYVRAAAAEIAQGLRGLNGSYTVINVVSTVMPGETRHIGQLIENISGRRLGEDFGLTHSPEFIRQGSIVDDFRWPEYIVIGEHNTHAGVVAQSYYESVVDNDPPIHHMSLESAELTKTGLNAVVVAKLALANELAWVCQETPGADARDVLAAIGADSRVGRRYFGAGTWPGGPCFPRDTRALAEAGRRAGARMAITEEVSRAADRELRRLADLCEGLMAYYPRVGILGLAYKPGVDVRDASQGQALFNTLIYLGEIDAHDPVLCKKDLDVFVANQDLLILMTCWPEYRALQEIDLSGKCIVDMWGYLDPDVLNCDRYVRFGEGSNALV